MKRPTRRRLLFLAAAAAAVVAVAASAILWHQHRRRAWRRLYRPLVWRHAEANGLPVELVEAVIDAESGGDPSAVSRRNARGLMQITPPTEREILRRIRREKGDLFDPEYNILLGTTYLRMMLDRFGGEAYLALAAYNWGPGNVEKARKAHPDLGGKALVEAHAPRETARYCRRILRGREIRLPPARQPNNSH